MLESGYRLQPQLAKYRELVSFTDTNNIRIRNRRPSIDGTKEPSIYKDPTMGGLKCSRCLDPFILSLTPVDNYTCDACKQFFPSGTKMYGCRVCNKDLCKNCKKNDRENAFVINPPTTKKKRKRKRVLLLQLLQKRKKALLLQLLRKRTKRKKELLQLLRKRRKKEKEHSPPRQLLRKRRKKRKRALLLQLLRKRRKKRKRALLLQQEIINNTTRFKTIHIENKVN